MSAADPRTRELEAELQLHRDINQRLLNFDGGAELMSWEARHRLHRDEPYIGCPFCRDQFVSVAEVERLRSAFADLLEEARGLQVGACPRALACPRLPTRNGGRVPEANDPLVTVWDALERQGCAPFGPIHQFRARCPGHDSSKPDSLAVGTGADGRALLWCHVGCDAHELVRGLGLLWSDMFPAGHRHARRSGRHARARRPVDLVLGSLRKLGVGYRCTRNPHMWIAEGCPACGAGEPLWIFEERNRVGMSCFNGCEQHDVLAKLEEAL